ncbi:hypothetical protein DFH11DRAFT_1610328 [Phellopilus nigrolimitatus]|nr:hypothetical protein DFH11DRAFT_1610328 [Phellopilus nigrolimitatus]
MFERKKRDNYLQKGLDLTAHTSQRVRQERGLTSIGEAAIGQKPGRQAGSTSRMANARAPAPSASSDRGLKSAAGPGSLLSTGTVSDLALNRQKQSTNSSASLDLKSDNDPRANQLTSEPSRPSRTGGSLLEIEKPSTRTHDRRARGPEINPISSTLIHSQTNTGLEDPSDTSSGSIGNVIAERLVHFSHRIMGSFGLRSSQAETSRPSSETTTIDAVPTLPGSDHQHSEHRGLGHQRQTFPLRLSELSPRKARQLTLETAHNDKAIIDDDSSGLNRYSNDIDGEGVCDDRYDKKRSNQNYSRSSGNDSANAADVGPAWKPLRVSRKRPAGGERGSSTDVDAHVEGERYSKRTRLSHEDAAVAAGITASPSQTGGMRRVSSSSRSRVAGTKSSRGLLANSKAKETAAVSKRAAVARNLGASGSGKNLKGRSRTERIGGTVNSCSLTVPKAPTFTGDVLRQQRASAKAERGQDGREKDIQGKGKLAKSDGVIVASSVNSKAPLSDTQQTNMPRPKPTVPHAFRFEIDVRLATRRQEFEEKIKTWEKRAASNESARSNSHSSSQKLIPDFKSLHATQEANMAVRRRELIAPTVPITPHFSTDIRIAEREKFDEARRVREKEIERLMEEKRRVREEEEKREWQEARKRAVPRANAVPEWYADVPKRSARN